MRGAVLCVLVAALVTACGGSEPPEDWVARVGDAYLTHSELADRYPGLGTESDTSQARRQLVQSWISDQLLLREARRRELADLDSVRRRIAEGRREILIDAVVEQIKSEVDPPDEAELRSYYERHRDDLRLREPYVRVRYLSTDDAEGADSVRTGWARDGPPTDSTWRRVVDRLADDPVRARRLSATFHPRSVLVREIPEGEARLAETGATGAIWRADGRTHLLFVVDRVPAGSVPRYAWVRDRIREQVLIRRKKLNYTRQVQRLQTQARANDLLEVNP